MKFYLSFKAETMPPFLFVPTPTPPTKAQVLRTCLICPFTCFKRENVEHLGKITVIVFENTDVFLVVLLGEKIYS